MLDHIEFLISEAFTALRRNGLMTFAAISTAAVALFLLGGLGYVYFRASQFAGNVSNKFEMTVFMRTDLDREKALQAMAKIKGMAGVKIVQFVPKETAWKDQQKQMGVNEEGLTNPLPDSVHVMLSNVNRADQLATDIQNMPEVFPDEGVQYSKDYQRLLSQMLSIVRWLGGALGILMLATAGILIYNAIRLTIIARRREIRIMQLVGAPYSTIWTPFVIEGAIQGAVGGYIAAFLLWGAQSTFQNFVLTLNTERLQRSFIDFPPYPLAVISGLLALIGAAYGFLCSSMAVREPLKQGSVVQK